MKKPYTRLNLIYLLIIACAFKASSQKLMPIAEGWSGNSINTVVFRKNSVTSHKDLQYVAFYDSSSHVVIAKRKLNSNKWEIKQTALTGNIRDAHNAISIITDGDGYLHIAWNHHGNKLHYTKNIKAGSLDFMDEQPMTGYDEQKVTYPEFYKLANGNLLFLYRDGASGNGNLILNHYNLKSKTWERMNSNLIDGEGKRNAYWQACVGKNLACGCRWRRKLLLNMKLLKRIWREGWLVGS